MPACAQLPAGPMSRCSHVAQCRLARRCTGTACGSLEKSVEKKKSCPTVACAWGVHDRFAGLTICNRLGVTWEEAQDGAPYFFHPLAYFFNPSILFNPLNLSI